MSTSSTSEPPHPVQPLRPSGPMAPDELAAFLAQPLIASLGCLDEAGWPYVVPISYHWADGGFYVAARGRAAWAAYLRRTPRCSLSITEPSSPRRVLVRGEADCLTDTPDVRRGFSVEVTRAIGQRYTGDPEYFSTTSRYAQEPGWGFFVRPVTITSWRSSEWASRYRTTTQ